MNFKTLILLYSSIIFISFNTLNAQTKSPEIENLESKIKKLKVELRDSELKLKTLRTNNQTGYTNLSINYSDKHIQSILNYLGPAEFHKKNNSWEITGIDAYKHKLFKIPIEDIYGLESYSEFYDILKSGKYYTSQQPYLPKTTCKQSTSKVGAKNISLEISSTKGYLSAYVYNCSDKTLSSYKIEITITKFNSSDVLSKTVVDILKNENVKSGEYKHIETSFPHNAKISGFLFSYDYKIIGE